MGGGLSYGLTLVYNSTPWVFQQRTDPHSDSTLGDFVQVQLLTSVSLPDGSTFSMPSSDYVVDAPGSGPACRTSGSIRGIKLPTLAKIEWTYMEWMFPSESDERPCRQTRAGYNPNAGTYELDPFGNPKPTFTMLQPTSPWLLETFTEETVTQGTSIDHSVYCFDSTTGFLRRKRMLEDSPNRGGGRRARGVHARHGRQRGERGVPRRGPEPQPQSDGHLLVHAHRGPVHDQPRPSVRYAGDLPVRRGVVQIGRPDVRETNYNGVGWKSQVSESYLLNTTPAAWTKYLSYDAFGRPGTVRPPDGQAHDVTFAYYGVRAVDRTVNVGTTYNAATGTVTEAAATTTEIYDHHGRLYKVTEPSGAAGANVTTTYWYDAADRLTHVQTTASGTTQNRWFNYDGRGFLTSEDHPEKGATGNGNVQYFTYDARGHASRRVDGPNDLTYVYDSAERLKDIRQTAGEQLPLKHFDYDTAAGWGNGKVAAATRYNYPYLGTIRHTAQIMETYTYSGTDGRASKRETALTFDGNPFEAFTQSFTWTPLGNVDTLTYPTCIVGRCPATSSRTVTNGYTLGYLTSVASGGLTYATISYHLNRMVNQVARENGITDTHTVDASGMAASRLDHFDSGRNDRSRSWPKHRQCHQRIL